jgi:hypothetical protein
MTLYDELTVVEEIAASPGTTVVLAADAGGRVVVVRRIAIAEHREDWRVLRARWAALQRIPAHHPFVTVREVTTRGGRYGVVITDHQPAGSLAAWIERYGPLDAPEVVGVARSAGEALEVLHAHGLPHGGVGPASIHLDEEGAALLDPFGGLAEPASTAHRAPEGAGTEAGDVYALAATLFHCLEGRPPVHEATTSRKAFLRLREAIEWGLHPDPHARPSVAQLLDHLAGLPAMEITVVPEEIAERLLEPVEPTVHDTVPSTRRTAGRVPLPASRRVHAPEGPVVVAESVTVDDLVGSPSDWQALWEGRDAPGRDDHEPRADRDTAGGSGASGSAIRTVRNTVDRAVGDTVDRAVGDTVDRAVGDAVETADDDPLVAAGGANDEPVWERGVASLPRTPAAQPPPAPQRWRGLDDQPTRVALIGLLVLLLVLLVLIVRGSSGGSGSGEPQMPGTGARVAATLRV